MWQAIADYAQGVFEFVALGLSIVVLLVVVLTLCGCGSISYDDSASSGLKAGATFGLPANPCDDGACATPKGGD